MSNKPGWRSFERDMRERVCSSGPTLGDLQRSLLAWVFFFPPMIRQWQRSHPLAAIRQGGAGRRQRPRALAINTPLSPETESR